MSDQEIDTVLGEDINFRGKLQFKKSLQINGRFRGVIDSPGHLVVGAGAVVEADIQAGSIAVQGELRGNVNAERRIELSRSAQLTGDLRAPDLEIQSGARFTGSCIME
ncbi:MAG: polymer-forming cytoskeletal protein [Leptospirales bacterium]|nr:polymer-forming cytoskeletal protein [Leptospirales bacterium]